MHPFGTPRQPAQAPAGGSVCILGTWVLLTLAASPSPSRAQVMPSERAAVEQTVDGAVMRVEYARPRARGREPLFGGVVDWGRVWTPGANDATVLDLSRNARVEGHEVPAGRWSVWLLVREQGPWEMILDPRDDLWHTAHPDPTDHQIRFPVQPEIGEHAEALLWYFPDVRHSGATLAMAWGARRVQVEIEVEPTHRYEASPEEAEPFLGSWEMERVSGRNAGQRRAAEIVHHDDGSLRLVGDGAGSPMEWVLQPKAEGVFQLGWTRDGALWSGSDMYLEATWEAGTPIGFEVRDGGDDRVWEGRRVR